MANSDNFALAGSGEPTRLGKKNLPRITIVIRNLPELTKYLYGATARYRKVANCSMSRLVAHFQFFRRLMKGKFDAFVLCDLWPKSSKIE